MRLFFSVFLDYSAEAQYEKVGNITQKREVDAEVFDPLVKLLDEINYKPQGKEFVYSANSFRQKKVANKEKQLGMVEIKEKYLSLVKGYPIEEMLSDISERDEKTAAYLIAIAKKESDWGKHSPKKNGKTCYNYWGYKGNYNPSLSGYSCFDSPGQAVQVVGDRITDLIGKKIDTPEKFVIWKCGSTCAGHDPWSVQKWISDVRLYYYKLIG